MKRLTALLLALALCLGLLTLPALADDADFVIDSSGILLEYKGPGGDVTIPNTVKKIGAAAFQYCYTVTGVTIPTSVTEIGDSAFCCCTGLTEVTIPSSVTVIGDNAFDQCTALTEVTIPVSVTEINESVFYCCSALTSVTLPTGVTKIGDYAFSGCSSLTGITIPGSVTEIGEWAFSYCGLTGITIPAGVTHIGNAAFRSCTGLTGVTIPAGVTELGQAVFTACDNLTTLTVAADNPNYKSIQSVLFNKAGDTLLCFPGGRMGNYTIPTGVTTIDEYAFAYCSGLFSVTIPAGVTVIGTSAFYYCTGLAEVTIPKSVTEINYYAFDCCTGLRDVNYTGSASDWDNIWIADGNDPLKDAAIHYNYGAIAPQPPANFAATPSNGRVTVTWTPSAGEENLRLYRREFVDGSWTDWHTVSRKPKGGSFADKTVEAGQKYEYKARSCNGGMESKYSAAVSVVSTPNPPKNVTAASVSGGVKVTWTMSGIVDRCRVYRQEFVGGAWSEWVSLDNKVNGTSYTDTSAVLGKTYRYGVKAYNGTWSKMSAASASVTALPGTPESVSVSNKTAGRLIVKWAAMEADRFRVYRRAYIGGTWTDWETVTTKATGTSYTDKTVVSGVSYEYRVRACKDGQWGDLSAIAGSTAK